MARYMVELNIFLYTGHACYGGCEVLSQPRKQCFGMDMEVPKG